MNCGPLKQCFLDLNKVAFCDCQDAVNEFKVTWKILKHRFLEFTQNAFWVGLEEENEFPVLGDQLKQRILDLNKDEFLCCQGVEYDF